VTLDVFVDVVVVVGLDTDVVVAVVSVLVLAVVDSCEAVRLREAPLGVADRPRESPLSAVPVCGVNAIKDGDTDTATPEMVVVVGG
jgi:hypothetical protein